VVENEVGSLEATMEAVSARGRGYCICKNLFALNMFWLARVVMWRVGARATFSTIGDDIGQAESGTQELSSSGFVGFKREGYGAVEHTGTTVVGFCGEILIELGTMFVVGNFSCEVKVAKLAKGNTVSSKTTLQAMNIQPV